MRRWDAKRRTSLTRVQELSDAGALRETVVLHTGSNGYVERSQLKQILQVLAPAQRIVVVNVDVPREWQDPNNELIAEIVAQTPNAVLADCTRGRRPRATSTSTTASI